MVRVGERDVGEVETAVALDPYVPWAVDHDLRDALVAKEVVDRSVPRGLGVDRLLQADPIGAAQQEPLLIERRGDVLGKEEADRFGSRGLEPSTDEGRDALVDPHHELDLAAIPQPAELHGAGGVGSDGDAHRC